jgi:hypothetical protein
MNKFSTRLLATALLAFIAIGTYAQVTTSSAFGIINDTKNQVLAGASVTYLYVPTGLKYGTMTDEKGNYTITNMNPGGPYTITVNYVGYQAITKNDIFISLGSNSRLDFTMSEGASEIKEVSVTAVKNKKSSGMEFGKDKIDYTPTATRSITDITKLTPQSNNNSFAGTNFRYNNVTLDGAINNDAIGFSPSLGGQSGTSNMPGSSTRSGSFSLDAIQEIQVGIAPYDVRLGNFTGGSINAVSRSGSNTVEGSVYGYGRGAFLTGNNSGLDNPKVPGSYYDLQAGFRIGLPIIKNKLFFFTNEEITRHQDPQFYAPGSTNSVITAAQAQQIVDSFHSTTFLKPTAYNKGTYDPGTYGAYNIHSYSYKFFNRLDYIINDKNQINIRNNTVISEATNLDNSSQQFCFGNYDFTQHNLNISTVAELKSRIGSKMSNSLIAGFTYIHDYRDPFSPLFPQIQITTPNGLVFAGTNREAGVFNMKQNTIELTDNFNIYKRKHKFTFGTHNEIYKINYGFVNSWNGRIDYNSFNDFIANKPGRIRAIYNPGDNSQSFNQDNSPANFWLMMFSAYAQDEMALSKRFSLSVGLRIDEVAMPQSPIADKNQASFPTTIANSGTTYTAPNLTTNKNSYTQTPAVSPRLGFNWDIMGNQKVVLRGGSGIFSGRIPFAWFGYAYYNNGTSFYAIDKKNYPAGTQIPTDPSTFHQYSDSVLKTNAAVERDVFANNFHMPQVWRSSLAVDFRIPGGVKLTLEALYTKTIYDVMIQQMNLNDSVKYAANDVSHQQPIYTGVNRNDNAYSSIYLVSNTSKGYRYSLTASAEKKFKFGLDLWAAYTYGQSKDILNGIRNSPESGWQTNQNLNPNTPTLAFSNFDIRHKIVATVTFHHDWNKHFGTVIGITYSASSGTPFTWTNAGNKGTNNGQQVELAYVPKVKGDLELSDTTTATWNSLNNFINANPYLNSRRGNFTERNGDRTPWNHDIDMRIMQNFYFYGKGDKHHKNTLQISVDLINLAQFKYYYTANTVNSSVYTGLTATGFDKVTNKIIYTYSAPTTTPYLVDQLASRLQAQLGVRYIF